MLNALRSLYSSVKSCIRLNGVNSDWFNVKTGLRQGCSLSPILFNLFINDLVNNVKLLNVGIDIGEDEKLCILLYADDIVLVAESETDLQLLLDVLSVWSETNNMSVNATKSQVIHFRTKSEPRSNIAFCCGPHTLAVVDKYVYLGLTLTEHLDYGITAKFVAQSAGRALGLLIARCNKLGGMPFDVFSKLYDSLVWPVIAYGASIWGERSYSCVDAIQHRAIRFFLGVGRYTPTGAVSGDMGWTPPLARQWISIDNFIVRMSKMDNNRLNKRIFVYLDKIGNYRCRNWNFRVKTLLRKMNCSEFIVNNETTINKRELNTKVTDYIMNDFKNNWLQNVNRINGINGRGGNKLRKYKLIKQDYGIETYCKLIMSRSHRAAFAKFRAGVAPLRIETGRYENLPVAARTCPFCVSLVEDEIHTLFFCPMYNDLRNLLFEKAVHLNVDFGNMTEEEKFILLFTNDDIIRDCAKTCFLILQRRQTFLCK
ncbi:uncharacterized protein LOC128555864 [Mercenaria mercenaria]|uniref:uncharacterized protein LOC128555864 n=1 Tax=Mercenaria mercenaria TaxID=6596 RepID=UPI00234E39D0|nr:uncharacterized protein LOC128555864 [Mercenaria mercenaria]